MTLANRLQQMGVVGLAATIFMPKGFAWFFFLMTTIGGLMLIKSHWQAIKKHEMALPVAVFVSLLLASTIWSDPRDSQFWINLGLYSLALLLPILSCTLSTHDSQRAIKVFTVASFVAAIVVMINWIYPLPHWQIWRSLVSYDGNKAISNAIMLSCGSAFAMHFAFESFKTSGRISKTALLQLAVSAIIAVAVVDTAQSRTALALLPGGIILACAFSPFKLSTKLIIGVLCIGLTIAGLATSKNATERFQAAMTGLDIVRPEIAITNSIAVRKAMNQHSMALIQEKPLTGYGLGGWAREWKLRADQHKHALSTTAHNEYLNIPAQLGVLGLAIFVAILVSMTRVAWRGSNAWKAYALIICLAWFWCSAFNAMFRDTVFALPFIVLTAVCLAASRTQNQTATTAI